jgi:hypothetical protein
MPRPQAPRPSTSCGRSNLPSPSVYERDRPGELLHTDIKKLGRFDRVDHRVTGDHTGQRNSRGIGRECVHICIDDASGIALSQILPDEKMESAIAFLDACKAHRLKHIRTKPYTPKTNGKAERFIPDCLA